MSIWGQRLRIWFIKKSGCAKQPQADAWLVCEACRGALLSSRRRCILTSWSFKTKHLPGTFTRSDDINCVVQKYDERFSETKAESWTCKHWSHKIIYNGVVSDLVSSMCCGFRILSRRSYPLYFSTSTLRNKMRKVIKQVRVLGIKM